MSNGEDKGGSKALELLIQVSAWTGGILAAAIGGFLVAFGSKDTPPEVLTYFKWAVIPLIFALLGTWYIQIHAVLAIRKREIDESKNAAAQATTASAAPVPSGQPANAEQDTRAPDTPKWRSSSSGNIRISIAFQVIWQTLGLIVIAVGVWRYPGPKSEAAVRWSYVSSEAEEHQTSYLLMVPTRQADGRTVPALRLLVSDATGGWRVCNIDPTSTDGHRQCESSLAPGLGGPALRLMGKPIMFHPLQYRLKYQIAQRTIDLTEEVCKAKRATLNARAGGVLVIGSHDRARVVSGAAVDSNESLARLRAASVAAFLAEPNDCGAGIESVIGLNAAPVLATRDVSAFTDVSSDRSVAIYGLVQR